MKRGGASWEGWHFGPYGRARDWRLIAPDTTVYTPGEIQAYHREALELDYMISRCRQLEALLAAKPVGLTPRERHILQQAAAILAAMGDSDAAAPRLSSLQILVK